MSLISLDMSKIVLSSLKHKAKFLNTDSEGLSLYGFFFRNSKRKVVFRNSVVLNLF